MHVLDMLKERGFIAQVTFEDDLYKALEREPMTFYLGIDPTADSLHVGHFMPIIVAGSLQRAGHRPIILCGGGTAMIGDPSGKSDLRKMMSRETICENVTGIQAQLSRFLDFSDGKAIMANNGDWLLNLNYIDFLREVGALFSVNRMLTAECYKRRMETFAAALRAALPGVELEGVHSGLHFLLTLPQAESEAAMVQAAAQHGVRLRGLSEYYMARPELCRPNTVVAGYSALKEDDIPAVAAALAGAWCSFL